MKLLNKGTSQAYTLDINKLKQVINKFLLKFAVFIIMILVMWNIVCNSFYEFSIAEQQKETYTLNTYNETLLKQTSEQNKQITTLAVHNKASGTIGLISDIKPIFDKANIPLSTWLTIAICESGLKPNAMLSNNVEVSKGLFQINVKCHTQFKNYDLNDPKVNAEIACKYFIEPAYKKSADISKSTLTRAMITYSGLVDPIYNNSNFIKVTTDGIPAGIRPQWTTPLREKFTSIYNTLVHLDN